MPSLWVQETLRVWVAVLEQVLLEADQLPAVHTYVQVLVSLKVWLKAPSVPQLNPEVGVQAALAAGALPAQNVPATVAESLRTQLTLRVWLAEFKLATQAPLRLCGRFVPQPVVGLQGE